MMVLLSILAMLLYFYSLYPAAVGFSQDESKHELPENLPAVSLVIPFRNEEANLQLLLQSIGRLDYPEDKLEVVFINDHSEDAGMDWLKQSLSSLPFSLQLLETPAASEGKKAALRVGITAAINPLIVSTDADCQFHPGWIKSIAGILQHEVSLLAAPVKLTSESSSVLHSFQAMESAMLMAITARSIADGKALLANGANLSFHKSLFEQAEALRRDEKLPGGDDIFLLEAALKISRQSVQFRASEALTVSTRAEETWNGLLNQRTRWASKVRFQADRSGFVTQIVAALYSLVFVISMFGFIGSEHRFSATIMLAGKLLIDYLCMQKLLPRFGYQVPLLHQLLASLIQPFIVLTVAWRVMFGSYQWRGRKYGV